MYVIKKLSIVSVQGKMERLYPGAPYNPEDAPSPDYITHLEETGILEPTPQEPPAPPRGSILTRAQYALEGDDYNTAAKIVNAHVLPDDAPYMRIKSEVMDTLSKWVKSQEERD